MQRSPQREECALRANHHGSRRKLRHSLAIITPIALLTAGILAVTPAISMAASPAATSASTSSHWVYACGSSFKPGKLNCLVIKNTSAHPSARTVLPDAIPAGNGYGPSQLQAAYSLASASASDGSGTTVAIVDAYDDPDRAGDLADYRAQCGLPACTTSSQLHHVQPGRRDLPARPRPDRRLGRSRSRPTSTWCRRSARTAISRWSRRTTAITTGRGRGDTAATPGAKLRLQQLGRPRLHRASPSTTRVLQPPGRRDHRRGRRRSATARPTRRPPSSSPRSAAPR